MLMANLNQRFVEREQECDKDYEEEVRKVNEFQYDSQSDDETFGQDKDGNFG
jgi:hypothetical protein